MRVAVRTGAVRLPGLHCYDFYGGPDTVRELFHMEPGTYLLTDYLVRTFDRTVLASHSAGPLPRAVARLLRPLHAGGVALEQQPTPEALGGEAERIACLFGLPLTTINTGLSRLEAALARTAKGEPMTDVPARASAVIVGAGIVGNSLVHHLALLGWTDLVLVDKGPLPNPGGSPVRVQLHLPHRVPRG